MCLLRISATIIPLPALSGSGASSKRPTVWAEAASARPVQRVEDFLLRRASTRLGDVQPTYRPGVTPCDLRECLPGFVADDLCLGLNQMDRQLRGFAHPDAGAYRRGDPFLLPCPPPS